MDENQQQPFEEVVETSNISQEDPESNTHSQDNSDTKTTRDMYNQACKDINGLPILGRIALALFILMVLFKLTPLLDLVWFFIQIIVIPCLVLISIGVISHDTYMLIIGWFNDTLVWATKHKDEIVKKTKESA